MRVFATSLPPTHHKEFPLATKRYYSRTRLSKNRVGTDGNKHVPTAHANTASNGNSNINPNYAYWRVHFKSFRENQPLAGNTLVVTVCNLEF